MGQLWWLQEAEAQRQSVGQLQAALPWRSVAPWQAALPWRSVAPWQAALSWQAATEQLTLPPLLPAGLLAVPLVAEQELRLRMAVLVDPALPGWRQLCSERWSQGR